jgi:hypothetical protein
MLNAEKLLAQLYALRKDYADDKEDPTYLALHHTFMFVSYQMTAFKQYVEEENKKAAKEEE